MARATCRGHNPAVSAQTGSIAGSRSGLVGRHDMIGMRHRQPVAEPLQLAGDQQLRARPASAFRGRSLKNTSSAKPVPSNTTTRQGWRWLAGGSWRITSTARVAIVAGLGGGDRRAGAAVQVGVRQMEQQVEHTFAADGARDQRRKRRADAAQAWSGARTAGRGGRMVAAG